MNLLSRTLLTLCLCITAPKIATAVELPGGAKLQTVDFERHVMGLLSKSGCNLGSCHGSFQGKNGFRLSLFGYEPAFDYSALTRDNLGRRVNLMSANESLVLLKGSGSMVHEGGMRFGNRTWVYDVFRTWIEQGAKWEPGSGTIQELTITPGDFATVQEGKELQVKVRAHFQDGTTEEITPFCDFKISDDSIATVTPTGRITAQRPGDAGLVVLYRGTVRAIRVLVPAPALKNGYPKVPAVNYIDTEVFEKLKRLNMVPSSLSTDAEFLRRVTIDTIAQLPTPEEIRTFLADRDPKKREKKIDELLKHPLHSALWATKLSDITGNSTDSLETNNRVFQVKKSQLWHDWLRSRIAENQPYDQLVRDIVTATSLDDRTPSDWLNFQSKIDSQMEKGFETDYSQKKTLDLFWRRQQNVAIEIWGEKVAAAFMGVRLECAQCHKHPTDRWTQEEYWAFANIFSQVQFGTVNANNPSTSQFSSRELKSLADKENTARKEKSNARNGNQILYVRELFVSNARTKANPNTNKVPEAKALGGPEIPLKSGQDARKPLAEWLTSAENPFFARSFVNRVWAHYLGIGLVNPVDDFSQANPPTNPRLLDALAADFTRNQFDLRKLEKTILMSRTYQLSSQSNETNEHDTNNYARSYIRPLMAEQVIDILNAALGTDEQFANDAPNGVKMTEVGASRLNNQNLAYVLKIFGRPPRTTACDCERGMEPALPQTLFRMTDPSIAQKLRASNGRIARLVKDRVPIDQAIDQLFLATLTRNPTEKEKRDAIAYVEEAKNASEALGDVLWALINTREFILNH